ncbi:MAG TPA: hypothetical protein VFR18_24710 [Terriglobia bacterium]|nr:hypothetical protein [Terriglobia bacterium]
MRRGVCIFAFGVILLCAATAASAQSSDPVINGEVQGVELCPQFICGAALFSGVFKGQIGGNPNAVGLITAAMTHGDLPTVMGGSTDIYFGAWELRTLTRRIRGAVLGGRIVYLGNDIFAIRILLDLRSGGGGFVVFEGLLNHQTLIPTFGGDLHQIP